MRSLARIFIVLRSVFFVLLGLSVALLSCSKDRPAPVAPAGKSLASLAAPAAPTNLRFDAPTDSSCIVRWDASDGATDYDVSYKLAVGGRWTNVPHRGTGLYNTIHGLQPNTEYRWAVRAENSDGASAWIFGSNFTTLPSDIEGDDNVSTGGDTTKDSDFSITLYWEATYPPHCISAVEDAVAKWQTIIIGDIQDGPIGDSGWATSSPSLPEDAVIDDTAIIVRLNEDIVPKAYAEYGTWRDDKNYTEDIGLPIFGFIYLPDILKHYRDNFYNDPVDEEGLRTDWWRPHQIEFEYDTVYHTALHEIGHVLGLVPSDDYQDRYGKFYGSKTIETWAKHAPDQLIRDYVPVTGPHWGSGYEDSDKYILTNSTMSQLRISHNDLFDVPLHLHPDKFAAFKIITDLDGAALIDLGYTIDMSATEPLVIREGTTLFGKANTHAWGGCGGIR